jgi:hypothetical protein
MKLTKTDIFKLSDGSANCHVFLKYKVCPKKEDDLQVATDLIFKLDHVKDYFCESEYSIKKMNYSDNLEINYCDTNIDLMCSEWIAIFIHFHQKNGIVCASEY